MSSSIRSRRTWVVAGTLAAAAALMPSATALASHHHRGLTHARTRTASGPNSNVCQALGLPSTTTTIPLGVAHVTITTCADAILPPTCPPGGGLTIPHVVHVGVFICLPPQGQAGPNGGAPAAVVAPGVAGVQTGTGSG